MTLVKRFLLSWLCLALGLAPFSHAAESPSLPAREKLHLYLLIGQSNMAGRGSLDKAAPVSNTRVLMLTPQNVWTPALEPLHADKPAMAGAGLGMTFARTMADADASVVIGLVPCAFGGTPLQRWEKGGDLYLKALERTRLALKEGTLKGILWHQGESDSGNEADASSYLTRLAGMIKDLRADLGAGSVPFVAGQLGSFLATTTKDGKPRYWSLINEQLAGLSKVVDHTAMVDSKGLTHKGDRTHFDTPSLRELGKRYAAAMSALQAQTP